MKENSKSLNPQQSKSVSIIKVFSGIRVDVFLVGHGFKVLWDWGPGAEVTSHSVTVSGQAEAFCLP